MISFFKKWLLHLFKITLSIEIGMMELSRKFSGYPKETSGWWAQSTASFFMGLQLNGILILSIFIFNQFTNGNPILFTQNEYSRFLLIIWIPVYLIGLIYLWKVKPKKIEQKFYWRNAILLILYFVICGFVIVEMKIKY